MENLKKKTAENGVELYFYSGHGWLTAEQVREVEEYKKFMYNPENSRNCENCPHKDDFPEKELPCGHQKCWVDCHCKL